MFIGPQMVKKMVLAGLVVLGGCESGKNHIEDFSDVPERHQVTARRVYNTHDVLFSVAQTALNESEGRRLQHFIDAARIGGTDQVYLVMGNNPLGRLQAQAVADFLAASKIEITPSPVGKVGPVGETVSVIVSRYVVSLPGCPDWTGERFTYNNVPTSNWGCATEINLGRMIARPEDLVRGRDPGTFDGEYGTRSIDLYRKGQTKDLTKESIGPIENQQQSTSQSSGSSSSGQGQ